MDITTKIAQQLVIDLIENTELVGEINIKLQYRNIEHQLNKITDERIYVTPVKISSQQEDRDTKQINPIVTVTYLKKMLGTSNEDVELASDCASGLNDFLDNYAPTLSAGTADEITLGNPDVERDPFFSPELLNEAGLYCTTLVCEFELFVGQ